MLSIAFAPLLVLAACDQQEAGPVDSEVSPTSGLDDEQTLPGERSLADETQTGPTRVAQALPGIPQPFLGVWDYSDGDGECDPGSELLMEIEAQRITFYESVGTVESVRPQGENAVSVELDMEGEGESWENTLMLSLSDNRATLRSEDAGGADADDAIPRRRCDP